MGDSLSESSSTLQSWAPPCVPPRHSWELPNGITLSVADKWEILNNWDYSLELLLVFLQVFSLPNGLALLITDKWGILNTKFWSLSLFLQLHIRPSLCPWPTKKLYLLAKWMGWSCPFSSNCDRVLPTASQDASQYTKNGLLQFGVRRIGASWRADFSCSNARFDTSSSVGAGASSRKNRVKGRAFAANMCMNLR